MEEDPFSVFPHSGYDLAADLAFDEMTWGLHLSSLQGQLCYYCREDKLQQDTIKN